MRWVVLIGAGLAASVHAADNQYNCMLKVLPGVQHDRIAAVIVNDCRQRYPLEVVGYLDVLGNPISEAQYQAQLNALQNMQGNWPGPEPVYRNYRTDSATTARECLITHGKNVASRLGIARINEACNALYQP